MCESKRDTPAEAEVTDKTCIRCWTETDMQRLRDEQQQRKLGSIPDDAKDGERNRT